MRFQFETTVQQLENDEYKFMAAHGSLNHLSICQNTPKTQIQQIQFDINLFGFDVHKSCLCNCIIGSNWFLTRKIRQLKDYEM